LIFRERQCSVSGYRHKRLRHRLRRPRPVRRTEYRKAVARIHDTVLGRQSRLRGMQVHHPYAWIDRFPQDVLQDLCIQAQPTRTDHRDRLGKNDGRQQCPTLSVSPILRTDLQQIA
jgi:hypothetical protein